AALAGGMGTSAGGNIGDGLSMFEPVHGSAPDIAGTGKANPIAAILSGALLLRHLKENEAAQKIENAIHRYLEESNTAQLPIEFSGNASCENVGAEILKRI
ncbi:MAG: isocitrate/isopropylmalate dehydrogenase family protein, partial [Synergistaceae bacterium]|nr:isocitrate/isopropylmalate dehydrogenase family protein [Synergistaceae bacterium]